MYEGEAVASGGAEDQEPDALGRRGGGGQTRRGPDEAEGAEVAAGQQQQQQEQEALVPAGAEGAERPGDSKEAGGVRMGAEGLPDGEEEHEDKEEEYDKHAEYEDAYDAATDALVVASHPEAASTAAAAGSPSPSHPEAASTAAAARPPSQSWQAWRSLHGFWSHVTLGVAVGALLWACMCAGAAVLLRHRHRRAWRQVLAALGVRHAAGPVGQACAGGGGHKPSVTAAVAASQRRVE
ncbi:hypothetical protein FOA52_006119 [Chlamydomonas sp. UWO 241]|nr:hypothetical protein FOA52_006119 [Chlamydomonas sp. UWO 241]